MQVGGGQLYRLLLLPADIEIGIVIAQAVLHNDEPVTAFPQMTAGTLCLANPLTVDYDITTFQLGLDGHIRVDRL